jgi:EpsI family protein
VEGGEEALARRILIVALVLSGAGIYARTLASQRVAASGMPQLAQLPSQLEHWFSEDLPLSESVAAVLAADATLQRVYRHPSGAEVLVFLAYFAEQQVNSQIHSPRNCVPGGGSNVVTVEPGLLQLAGKTLPMTAMVLEKLGQRQEMLYWFRTRGGTVTGEYALKMDLVRNALARRPTDAVFVRYLAPAEHADAMRALIAALDPHLEAILGGVGL